MSGLENHKEFMDKTLLMVDDEIVVVDVIKEVVGRLMGGFDIAANGIKALVMLADKDYDFILLDVKMPVMDGIELFKYIENMKPYLVSRVIFITGDTETQRTRNFIRDTGCRYIDKPFSIKELLELMAIADFAIGGQTV